MWKKLRAEVAGQGPKTSNGLTAFLFLSKCAGSHHPRALINALVIYVMWMARRGTKDLHKLKYRDLYITNSNDHIFVNLHDVLAKNWQEENPQDQNHNRGSLCRIKEKFKCQVSLLTLLYFTSYENTQLFFGGIHNQRLIKFCFPGQILLQRKCDKTLITCLLMWYQHLVSLLIDNFDITTSKPREIPKLSLSTRQASWTKVLISHEKECD